MKKLLSLAIVCLCLQSCSFISVGYRFADWIIKRKILEVVKLYSPQQEALEKELDEFMKWHKEKVLPQYVSELQELEKRVDGISQKAITSDEVLKYMLKMRTLYRESFSPLAKKVSPILAELKSEQVDRTQVLLNRRMDEIKKELEIEKEERIKETKEKWTDNLAEWVGDLTEEQKKYLAHMAPRLLYSSKARYARAGKQVQRFLAVFHDIPLEKKEKRVEALNKFFKNWSQDDVYEPWRQRAAVVLSHFFNSLTKEQKIFLKKKIADWKETLQDIVKDD